MPSPPSRYIYPPARKSELVEDFHGVQAPDPYKWLEDAASEETQNWIEAQNELSAAFLADAPARELLRQRLTALWNYPRCSIPYREGTRYFFSKNDGLQDQPVLYWQETLHGDPAPVLDPNALSEDGTSALTNEAVSQNGNLLAYGISSNGSDWQEIRIREVVSGREHDEVIRWCKFAGIAWRHDGAGFYYNRFPEPGTVSKADESNYNRVYWHRLGAPQAQDELVYERPDAKELGFNPSITDDGQYLILHVWHGTNPKNRIYYRKIGDDGSLVRLLDEADARYLFVGNVGSLFYFHTDLDAPRGRIIAIDVENPARERWREILPQGEDAIAFVALVNDQLAVATMHHAHHQLKLYSLDGALARQIELPALGSILGLTGKCQDREMFVGFESFLYPLTILRYDFETERLETFFQPQIDFDLDAYETRQVFYASKDGTRVPMFLIHKRGLDLNGDNPTLLYGYGGFNISLTPSFWVSRLVWLEQGGVFAVANLRGGGEYGKDWHQAGVLERKQNVFDDFMAAAEWLVEQRYTSSSKLAIMGGSNGGLLVAACMVQRPELFGAVICRVPVTDMLHYHKWTVGRYWVSDYGNAEQNPEHFRFLYAYSPLHNVRPGASHPPTLIMTADTDDRVAPAHATKFAAALQAQDAGQNPILLRMETRAGHGFGKPTSKLIEEQSDIFAFLFRVFGMGA